MGNFYLVHRRSLRDTLICVIFLNNCNFTNMTILGRNGDLFLTIKHLGQWHSSSVMPLSYFDWIVKILQVSWASVAHKSWTGLCPHGYEHYSYRFWTKHSLRKVCISFINYWIVDWVLIQFLRRTLFGAHLLGVFLNITFLCWIHRSILCLLFYDSQTIGTLVNTMMFIAHQSPFLSRFFFWCLIWSLFAHTTFTPPRSIVMEKICHLYQQIGYGIFCCCISRLSIWV